MANECSHEDYYGQFVTPGVISRVSENIGKKAIMASTCSHMNDIPLSKWDCMGAMFRPLFSAMLKKAGDFYSMAGNVCILKQAARMIKEGNA